jgi:CRISPR/Cas system-associated exonuclease Cas4 (RecB family)
MADFINSFSWSISRSEMFDYCKRKYYLNYYDSWGGWEWNATARRRLIYFLKNRQFAGMWVGDVVHKAIKYAIENRFTVDEARVVDALTRRLEKDFQTSSAFTKSTAKPKDLWLFEHYKKLDIDLAALTEKAITCIRSFFRSDPYRELMEIENKDILYLDSGNINEMQFDLDNTVVYAIPDLCYRNKDGHFVLIDWKTGRAPDTELTPQLKLYALRLSLTDQLHPDDKEIFAYSIYLQDGSQKGRKINEGDLDLIRAKATASVAEMKDALRDAVNNVPKDVAVFPKTDHTKKCLSCVYREVCEEDDF